jgi:hypothetical protein
MADAAAHRRFEQVARFHRVAEIVAERIGDRVRHHDLGREVDDGGDLVLAQHALDQRAVADIAIDERHVHRHRPAETRRKVVDHDRPLVIGEQFKNHVAADIPSAAGDQYSH